MLTIEFLENLIATSALPRVLILHYITTVLVLRLVINTVVDALYDIPNNACLFQEDLLCVLLILLGVLILISRILIMLASFALLDSVQGSLLGISHLDLHLDLVVILLDLDVVSLVHEDLPCPSGDDQTCLLLSNGIVAFLVLVSCLVLLGPLIFHLSVQIDA